jgi:hypothetical protein
MTGLEIYGSVLCNCAAVITANPRVTKAFYCARLALISLARNDVRFRTLRTRAEKKREERRRKEERRKGTMRQKKKAKDGCSLRGAFLSPIPAPLDALNPHLYTGGIGTKSDRHVEL